MTGNLRSLLINELEINPAILAPVLHYDGTPITADFISNAVLQMTNPQVDTGIEKVAAS